MTNKGMVELKAGPGYTYTTAEKDFLIWWIMAPGEPVEGEIRAIKTT